MLAPEHQRKAKKGDTMSSQKNGKTGHRAVLQAKGNKTLQEVRTSSRWNKIKAEISLQGSMEMGHSLFTGKFSIPILCLQRGIWKCYPF